MADSFMEGKFCKEEFKVDYKNYGADNLLVQVPHLAKLADVYMKKATENKGGTINWLNYLKAHALLNSCLARDHDRDKWLPKIYQIEAEYYDGNHPWTEQQHKDKTGELKQQLINLREDVSTRLKPIEKLIVQFDIDDDGPANQDILDKVKKMIYAVSHYCAAQMVQLSKEVLLASEAIVDGVIPQYCAVALGSIARSESTPYSDIEYLFLCASDADTDILKQVAIDSYFRMHNFGETSLKYMYIEELHDSYQVQGVQDTRWFEDRAKNGFKIDGFLPHSGNIPTGNTLGGKDDFLIRTSEQLYQLYTKHIHRPVNHKSAITGDMSDFLTSTRIIHANDNGEKLLENFRCLVSQKLSTDNHAQLMRKRNQTLLKDLEKFSFTPSHTEFRGFNFKQREVKMDIFRFPTLLIAGLSREPLMNMPSWQALDAIYKDHTTTIEQHKDLTVLLTIALLVRLSAYSTLDAQRETLSFMTSNATTASDRYYFPRQLFIFMSMALIRIRELISGNGNVYGVHSKLYKAEALLFCGDFTRGLIAIQEWLGVESLEDPETVTTDLMSRDAFKCAERLQMIADTLAETGNYTLSLSYLKKEKEILEKTDRNSHLIHRLYRAIGMNYQATGNYEEAAKKSQYLLTMHETFHGTNSSHPHIASSHNQLGNNLSAMALYKEAVEHHTIALKMVKIIHGEKSNHPNIASAHDELGTNYSHMGMYDEAAKHYNVSLEMRHIIHGIDSNHPDIASSHHQLAMNYAAVGQYMVAEEHFRKSLEVNKIFHGTDNNHSDIASSHHHLGINYTAMGKYEEAAEHYKASLEMEKVFHGVHSNHPNIASAHHQLGMNYADLGNYVEAEKHYNASLEISKITYGADGNHPNIASSHHQLGVICSATGKYEKAAKHYKISLEMNKTIYGDESNHPNIAGSHLQLGINHTELGEYERADEHYKQSLEMFQIIHGMDSSHPNIASAHLQLGRNYAAIGQYSRAAEHYRTSLEMKKLIHGAHSCHPDIAGTHRQLGINFAHLGQYVEAGKHFNTSLEMIKKIHGEDGNHPDIAAAYHQVGVNLATMGNYGKAVEHCEKSLKMLQIIHGVQAINPSIAGLHHQLGKIHDDMGHSDKSLEHYWKSLDIRKQIYGQDNAHPEIAATHHQLGILYYRKNSLNYAMEHAVLALRMFISIHVEDSNHPLIAGAHQSIGNIDIKLGEFHRALSHFNLALKIFRSVHGERSCHPGLAITHQSIGSVYRVQGDTGKAYAEYLKAATMLECTFGYHPEHPYVRHCKGILVDISHRLRPSIITTA